MQALQIPSKSPPRQSAGGWDFSFLSVGDYWMCFQPAGGNFTPQAAVAIRGRPLRGHDEGLFS